MVLPPWQCFSIFIPGVIYFFVINQETLRLFFFIFIFFSPCILSSVEHIKILQLN